MEHTVSEKANLGGVAGDAARYQTALARIQADAVKTTVEALRASGVSMTLRKVKAATAVLHERWGAAFAEALEGEYQIGTDYEKENDGTSATAA